MSAELAELIERADRADTAAAGELFALLYDELRRLAERHLKKVDGLTLTTTRLGGDHRDVGGWKIRAPGARPRALEVDRLSAKTRSDAGSSHQTPGRARWNKRWKAVPHQDGSPSPGISMGAVPRSGGGARATKGSS